jgi:predicted transcriptional regulator
MTATTIRLEDDLKARVAAAAHRYSVSHSLVGLKLEARITDALVEVLHRGERVACHSNRVKGP